MELYNEMKGLMDKFRKAVNESSEWSSGYKEGVQNIPYNMQDELMASAVEACKQQFGADFDNYKTPMLYYPNDGDVVLSGEIGSLNNAKFQFRLKDPSGDGCFIWTEPIQLTEANLNQLKIVYGVYKNWKSELETAEDKKPMGYKNIGENETNKNNPQAEQQENNTQSQAAKNTITPGDDLD